MDLAFAIGTIFGCVVTNIIMWYRTRYGVLKIDSSNPEKDVYRFEISDKEIDTISKAKRIMLRIEHHADLSQK